jgi:hypothetical protein
MVNIILKTFVVSTFIILLNGCANDFLNEGAMRVRLKPAPNKLNSNNLFEGIYFKPDTINLSTIKKGGHFSVSLLSAHICDFRESQGLDFFTLDGSNASKSSSGLVTHGCTNGGFKPLKNEDRVTRGEIAIVANVGESSNTKSLSTNSTGDTTKGRVIYYGDDVRESGQLINAINLPIYGPKKYNGKNFVFELWMLELDNDENEQIKGLLQSLADLGGKAYPPSAPVLSILNTLGSAFLSGNQDDVEARFQMRFDVPAPNTSNIHRLPLAEGYYAFVREENRDISPEWSQFSVNKELGELCKANANGFCIEGSNNTYRERTWFLVRVARESAESALDIEYGEKMSEFLKTLDSSSSININKTKNALKDLGNNLEILLRCSKNESKSKECKKQ